MIAGITGHQYLGDIGTKDWVKNSIMKIINEYKIKGGFTCLAIGADQLYAELLNKSNLPYSVIIPSDQYEKTFHRKNYLVKYQELLNAAYHVVKLKFDKPDELAFYEAGKKLTDSSDMLIAVWDGNKAKGLGGTADIVEYAISKKRKIIHINPITHTIAEINQ